MTPLPVLRYTADMNQQDPDHRFEDLKHQFELLETKMEANVKTMKAENEAALSKNDAAIDRLRATIEGQSKEMVKFIATMSVAIVVVLGAFIAFLQFYK
ncbi:MAG: hypothetical protein OXF24_03830 [Hyphomicrobiales bacterium]|nr:hypothetical protein [Hyphomicrobiales bacterium]